MREQLAAVRQLIDTDGGGPAGAAAAGAGGGREAPGRGGAALGAEEEERLNADADVESEHEAAGLPPSTRSGRGMLPNGTHSGGGSSSAMEASPRLVVVGVSDEE